MRIKGCQEMALENQEKEKNTTKDRTKYVQVAAKQL